MEKIYVGARIENDLVAHHQSMNQYYQYNHWGNETGSYYKELNCIIKNQRIYLSSYIILPFKLESLEQTMTVWYFRFGDKLVSHSIQYSPFPIRVFYYLTAVTFPTLVRHGCCSFILLESEWTRTEKLTSNVSAIFQGIEVSHTSIWFGLAGCMV